MTNEEKIAKKGIKELMRRGNEIMLNDIDVISDRYAERMMEFLNNDMDLETARAMMVFEDAVDEAYNAVI